MIDSKEIKGCAGSSDNQLFAIGRISGINTTDSKQPIILQPSPKASNCKTSSQRYDNLNEPEEHANCDESTESSTFGKQYANWLSQLSCDGLEDSLIFSDSEQSHSSDDKKVELHCLLKRCVATSVIRQ